MNTPATTPVTGFAFCPTGITLCAAPAGNKALAPANSGIICITNLTPICAVPPADAKGPVTGQTPSAMGLCSLIDTCIPAAPAQTQAQAPMNSGIICITNIPPLCAAPPSHKALAHAPAPAALEGIGSVIVCVSNLTPICAAPAPAGGDKELLHAPAPASVEGIGSVIVCVSNIPPLCAVAPAAEKAPAQVQHPANSGIVCISNLTPICAVQPGGEKAPAPAAAPAPAPAAADSIGSVIVCVSSIPPFCAVAPAGNKEAVQAPAPAGAQGQAPMNSGIICITNIPPIC